MRECQAAGVDIGKQRLHIPKRGLANGRIADMANRRGAGEAVDDGLSVEVIAHESQTALGMKLLAVEGYDAGCFLAAVLQGVKTEGRERCGVGMIENPKDPALFVEPVGAEVENLSVRTQQTSNPVQP